MTAYLLDEMDVVVAHLTAENLAVGVITELFINLVVITLQQKQFAIRLETPWKSDQSYYNRDRGGEEEAISKRNIQQRQMILNRAARPPPSGDISWPGGPGCFVRSKQT